MFNMAKHGQDNYTIHLQKCPRIDCKSQMLHKKSKRKSPGDIQFVVVSSSSETEWNREDEEEEKNKEKVFIADFKCISVWLLLLYPWW